MIPSARTSFTAIQQELERAKELSPAIKPQADEVYGHVSAREAEASYETGDYRRALLNVALMLGVGLGACLLGLILGERL